MERDRTCPRGRAPAAPSPDLGIEPMRGAGLEERQQIEVLPDLDELSLANVAHQDDGQVEFCTRAYFVG